MKKILDRITDAIAGDLTTDKNYLDYYSTDGSVFELTPTAVCFPRDAIDVQNIVRIIHEEAQAGHYLPITPRGKGTDQGGGPLGTGLIMDFTRYMNHILEIGDDFVRVQPGAGYGHLQRELRKRGKYLPPYPASIEICSIGGAVANNSAGEKTVKYGATRNYVRALNVILSNGDMIETKRLTRRQLSTKRTSNTFEAKIYKQMQTLIEKNNELISSSKPRVTKNSSGYALWEVDKHGLFDLAQLFTGAQGTLGIVTEIELAIVDAPEPQDVVLAVSHYKDLRTAGSAIHELNKLQPSALEIVDINLLNLVYKQDPNLLKGLLPKTMPAIVLLTEFDNKNHLQTKSRLRRAEDIFKQYAFEWVKKDEPNDQARLWKLRRSAAAVMWTIPGTKKALPIIEDGVVPAHKIVTFFERAYEIFDRHGLEIAVWGHAGDANLHMQPFMDLGKDKDRKKIFQVTDEFYKMVIELGGVTSAEHNDGLMRSPYLPILYGTQMCALFDKVKHIFDPLNILNPHKKTGVDFNFVKQHLRHEYSVKELKTTEQVDR